MSYQGRGRRFYFLILLLLVVLVVDLPWAHAESIASLATGADTIVIAVPLQKVSFWQNGLIKTRALLRVEQVVAGKPVGEEVSVIYEGGVVGKIGLKVSHGVVLPPGQRSVLFLVWEGGHYAIYHDAAGIFFVHSSKRGAVVIPVRDDVGWPGVSLKGLREKGNELGEGIPLSDFLSTVHRLWEERP